MSFNTAPPRLSAPLLVLLLVPACKQGAVEPTPVEPTPPPAVEVEPAEPIPEPEPPPPPPREWDTTLTQSTRLLAGLDLPEDSPLYPITQTASYVALKQQVDAAWKTYEEKDRAHIVAWQQETLSSIPAGPVFYPFSGPDILNAVTFLPQGTSYMMFGLEPVGSIPRLEGASEAEVSRAIQQLNAALVEILGMNFFHTKIMAVNIGSHPYNGIAGVMCWFLARTGYDVLEAREVTLTPAGEIAAVPAEGAAEGSPVGVEITFRTVGETSDEAVKKAWYFPGDISDDGWTRTPGLAPFVMAQGEVVTFLKAASYLMFRNGFDDVRSAILARSVAVIEDSSGIPYHYFTDASSWNTRLYGLYTRPIPLFEVRCQPDLAKASAEHSMGELPFSFGYTHWQPHLLFATRPEGRALEEPVYDGSSSVGESTYCHNGQLVIEGR